MAAPFVLLLYLTDEILSAMLPFSSGTFALVAIAGCMKFPARSGVGPSLYGYAALAFVMGSIGAVLSGTPMSAFSLATIFLMTAMWVGGARLRPDVDRLVSGRGAFVGLMVSMFFLCLSSAGLDAFSIITGHPTARPSGLYLEPSHLALYVMPLWLIAFNGERRHRPWLYVALALMLATRFTASLVAILIVALMLHQTPEVRQLRRARRRSPGKRRYVRWSLIAFVAFAVTALPLPLYVEGVPVREYIGKRLSGFSGPENTEGINLSSLVILQGAEIAVLSIQSTRGLGVGLGNLGTSPAITGSSAYRALISSVTVAQLDINLRDGAILINKLIGELGVLTLGILLVFVKYLRRVRRIQNPRAAAYHQAMATVLLSLLFIRALPYFSAPACLVICSLASVLRVPQRRRANPPASPASAHPVQPIDAGPSAS